MITQAFISCERPKSLPGLLLGHAGMGWAGILTDYSTSRWYFNDNYIIDPLEATRAIIEEKAQAYVAYVTTVHTTEGTQPDDTPSETWRSLDKEVTVTIPTALQDFSDVFSEDLAREQPLLKDGEHRIELQPGTEPPYGPIYSLSAEKIENLQKYITENIGNGRIAPSTSPAGFPVLFVPKNDGSLRLCIDYRGLNRITIKNRYPILLIGDLLDQLCHSAFFSKIDLRDAYNRIRIHPDDRWKTAFRTRYGHFEYTVMPFGLTNAPATFQAYVHKALAGLVDVFCVAYLDDILIFSRTYQEHIKHLRLVLERLRKFELYAKLSKCFFFRNEVEFLGFIVGSQGVRMDPDRVGAITEWPVPRSSRDIQVFLGFANFYRRFIAGYSRITRHLTSLLKGSQNGTKSGPFVWNQDAQDSFDQLKAAFTTAGVLQHWDPARPTRVETDTSQKALSGVLSQRFDGKWHPIAYWSRKLSKTEQRWATG